jgi:hypothetical protein
MKLYLPTNPCSVVPRVRYTTTACGGGVGTLSRLFPSTSGPAAATANAGPFINGVGFFANQGGQWLRGYYFWCCNSGGQLTGSTKAALWIQTGAGTGTLVAGSVATATSLTPGTWNYIALPSPILLTVGVAYIAAVAVNGPTPLTANQFGAAQPFVNGLTSGAVSCYSDATSGGAFNNPWTTGNGLFTTAGNDPALFMPNTVSNSSNFWVDVSLSSNGPYTSYRLWPQSGSTTYDPNTQLDIAANYALSTEIDLARSCTVQYIWFYSPATVTQLPTVTDIWSVNTGGLTGVNVYTNASPGWSGVAGSGWVRSAVSSLTLPAGNYRVGVYNGAGSPAVFSAKRLNYWGGSPQALSVGINGVTVGPLTAPSYSSGAQLCYSYGTGNAFTEPGQNPFAVGPPDQYPNQYVGVHSTGGNLFQNYWVDLEVI